MARGPAYPFVDLEQAVGFAQKMYQFARRSPTQAESVIQEAWRYSPTSSGSQKTLAALKYFGLLEDVKGNEGRLIRISDRAYRIIIDDVASIERRNALQEAALSPKAYLLCWTRWGKDMPPSMRSTLIFDEGFIESTVDGFIADYKKSMEYAGLIGDAVESEPEAPEAESQPSVRLNQAPVAPKSTISSSNNLTVDADYRSDIFSLIEGNVSLTWPKQLSADSFQDLSDWLDIVKRKIERTVSRGSQESDQN